MAFDIAIVGGGLSGLALAAEFAQAEFSKLRVVVLEQRQSYVRDRTWSYWKTPQDPTHRYSHLERQQWTQWQVRQGDCTHRHASPASTNRDRDTSYCTLDGDAFYAAAQQAISQSGHVEVRMGTPVRQIVSGPTPKVITVSGEEVSAQWIFDARPAPQSSAKGLVQQFVGYEIQTDQDVFDTETVELMHFQPSAAGLHFFYVLPYGPRNALIETTWISPAALRPDFESELLHYIKTLIGSSKYDVLYTEKGSLGLCPSHAAANTALHIAPLGRNAGTLRASTGYAFLETLIHTRQIAKSLKRHMQIGELRNWLPPTFTRSALDATMDTVFLKVLARDWSESSGFFMQLFERVDADTLVAFLSGKADWRQRLSVAGALPVLPFAAQALSMCLDWVPRLKAPRP